MSLPRSGTEFVKSLPTRACDEREEKIRHIILSGFIPAYLLNLCELRLVENRNELRIKVIPDYISVGSYCMIKRTDFVRVPLTPNSAKKVAKSLGCVLPTRKLANKIFEESNKKIDPCIIETGEPATSTSRFYLHNSVIQYQLDDSDFGKLIAGHKKDIVYTNKFSQVDTAVYGFHKSVDYSTGEFDIRSHDPYLVDYSHGVRLIARDCWLNGKLCDLKDIYSNDELCILVSDEGPIYINDSDSEADERLKLVAM